jgi:hypothetical protein
MLASELLSDLIPVFLHVSVCQKAETQEAERANISTADSNIENYKILSLETG